METSFCNVTEFALGEGGQNPDGSYKQNVMQMFHGAYNIQNWQEVAELKELWKYITDVNNEDNTFCKLDEPVHT
eukprot:3223074-Ditylum_brightwellii.AAC.1